MTNTPTENNISITVNEFGNYQEDAERKTINSYTIKNRNGMIVSLLNYGATIQSLKVPDIKGDVKDIVLGYDDIEGYQSSENPYFGCVVGRVANRIDQGKFYVDGKLYQASLNRETYTLHGGYKGFDKALWNGYVLDKKVIFTYLSKDMEEGFPGDLLVTAQYELTNDNILKLEMTAMTTKPTIVNLTNHSYFNLAGHESGRSAIEQHTIEMYASELTETDANSIPTGNIVKTYGTEMDLEKERNFGEVLRATGGIDHNYCISHSAEYHLHGKERILPVARVAYPSSGRVMKIYSNQLGVQLYTANYFPKEGMKGKFGQRYFYQGAFCLETQNFPDAANHNFVSDITMVKIDCDAGGGENGLLLSSVYLPYEGSKPSTKVLEQLVAHCFRRGEHAIFGCDANSYHKVWGSKDIDKRGGTGFEETSSPYSTNLTTLDEVIKLVEDGEDVSSKLAPPYLKLSEA